jgi:membrane-associated HD superfamily phosphohydrolase
MNGLDSKKNSVFSEVKSQKSNETVPEKTKNVSLRVTSISIHENHIDERKKSQFTNEKKSQIEN